MLDRILIGSSAEPSDPNFKNVTLLLHGDGSNGAQNNTFIDSSTNNFTITRNGNTTQGSFSPYGSNWSNYFDGSGDYLTLSSNAAFGFGTGDFTVEFWVYLDALPSSGKYTLVDFRAAADAQTHTMYVNSSGYLGFFNGSTDVTSSSAPMSGATWTHIAYSRASGTLRIYVNGAQAYSASNSIDYQSSRPVTIGAAVSGIEATKGYISNFRILKGTGLYTSTFTPSTTPLTAITNTSLLTCAYNRFRDGSTNNFTITRNGDVKVTNFAPFAPSSAYSTSANSGSVYGDGTGDGLTVATNTAFAFGTGDFTIEFWGYYPGWAGDAQLVGAHTAFVGFDFLIQQYGSGAFRWLDSSLTLSSGYVPPTGSWHHYAVTRSGTTLRIFVDGDLKASGTSTANISSTFNIGILCDTGGSASQVGYMSDVRIVKGTAVYTASFTPPTSPLTAISGTSLLVKGQNAAIFDNSMKNDLETVGNAQISTSVKKFGTGSMYFDGTGDSCRIAIDDPNLQFNTGNFTAEGWIYSTGGTGTYQHVLTGGTSWTTNSGGIYWYYNGGSPTLGAAWNHLPANPAVNSGTLAINTWHHFALVRNGNTLSLYINGTSVSTYSVSGYNLALNNQSRTNIGGGGWDNDFAGYIDDLRITKGVARYTANFTAPTAPFPNK